MTPVIIWNFIRRNWVWLITVLAALLVIGLLWNAFKPKKQIVIPEATLQKINSNIEAVRKEGLQEVITINADTVKTTDDRNAITDVAIEERSAAIEAKVAAADKAITEAGQSAGRVDSATVECVLVPEHCEAQR